MAPKDGCTIWVDWLRRPSRRETQPRGSVRKQEINMQRRKPHLLYDTEIINHHLFILMRCFLSVAPVESLPPSPRTCLRSLAARTCYQRLLLPRTDANGLYRRLQRIGFSYGYEGFALPPYVSWIEPVYARVRELLKIRMVKCKRSIRLCHRSC